MNNNYEINISNDAFTKCFDETCIGWHKDPEVNKVYLLTQQRYANMLLQTRGILSLNEVFDILGMPRTAKGQIAGWVWTEDCTAGDNFVDFGLYDADNDMDVVRDTNVFRLKFNAISNILIYLDKE